MKVCLGLGETGVRLPGAVDLEVSNPIPASPIVAFCQFPTPFSFSITPDLVFEEDRNNVKAETSGLPADKILRMIRNGDHFVLLNENGQPTHTIKESDGDTGFKLIPIQSPGHLTGSG